jgi:hypothetical protein
MSFLVIGNERFALNVRENVLGGDVKNGFFRRFRETSSCERRHFSRQLGPFRRGDAGISPATASPGPRCKLTAHRIKRTTSAARARGETRDKQLSSERN